MSESLRPPREEDVPLVVSLINEHSPESVDAETVRREWTSPTVDLENDSRIEADSYCLVEDLHEGRAWLAVHGRPSGALLDWCESRALEKGPRLFSGAWSSNGGLLAALDARGFEPVRHSCRMEIDLEQPRPLVEWPEGIAVRSFGPGDERAFYEVHQETFEDTWEPIREAYDEWAHWSLQPPVFTPDLWFLACSGDTPAGFAICHPHATRAETAWVRVLGVRSEHRRRGLARALLLHAFHTFAARGFRSAGLGVDSESPTGANKLYESVGMREVARFEVREKVVA